MKLQLLPLDQEFLETIEGHEGVIIDEKGVYHVFSVDHEPAGIVGRTCLRAGTASRD